MIVKTEIERVQLYSDKDINKGELIKMDDSWEWESLEGHHRYKAEELRIIADLVDLATTGKLNINVESQDVCIKPNGCSCDIVDLGNNECKIKINPECDIHNRLLTPEKR